MRSTEEWKFWGRQDPMWAVATWKGRERDGTRPWTIEGFRASGRSDCADIMRHWDHYGRLSGGVCIEIGCGSGRLLVHSPRIDAAPVFRITLTNFRQSFRFARKGEAPR